MMLRMAFLWKDVMQAVLSQCYNNLNQSTSGAIQFEKKRHEWCKCALYQNEKNFSSFMNFRRLSWDNCFDIIMRVGTHIISTTCSTYWVSHLPRLTWETSFIHQQPQEVIWSLKHDPLLGQRADAQRSAAFPLACCPVAVMQRRLCAWSIIAAASTPKLSQPVWSGF